MKFFKILILSILLSFTCNGQVKLSFKNDSSEKFKILMVETLNADHKFKNLNPGESTLPIIVSGSYPYCPLKIITERDTITFYPIDYMGERYYKRGKLVMHLTLGDDNSKRRIIINAKR